jgi:hypothetical protein
MHPVLSFVFSQTPHTLVTLLGYLPNSHPPSGPVCNRATHLLRSAFGFRLATLHPLGLRAVDDMVRNPAFIICLLRDATCHSGSISSTRGYRFLGGSCRALSTFATLASSLLWEESLDPCLINEVEGSSESREEEEIQEDSDHRLAHNHSRDYSLKTYIWGSKRLVAASTTETVPLKAWT